MGEVSWKDQFWHDLEANRRLTVQVAQAFGPDALWTSPVPAMRPFGIMLEEILGIERAYFRGLVAGDWTFAGLTLDRADPWPEVARVRAATAAAWGAIPATAFGEVTDDPFGAGMPRASLADRLQYALENEIHHRGQAYVYLRLLGIEPPPFWNRS